MWRHLRRSIRTLTSQQAYSQWAADYPPVPHNLLMEIEHQSMLALMPTLQGCVVLDLACGTGRWGQWATRHGAAFILGLDNSMAMLQNGVLKHGVQAHMSSLPVMSASVDVVLCGLAIGHISHAVQTIVEVGRILKSGGVALFSDFHPHQAWSGAQRTFVGQDGKTYAVEHYVHSYADWHAAATEANLHITGVNEPRCLNESPQAPPMVLVLRLEK